ncbi:hypothetical protein DPMN_014697 [Dreissena polymorpha]|uniref:Uncharacterized protein n=1 Tax=Dreissena polymorpha TaxID=45954 RepID=A0A9D4S5G8_DREPO|nr:hypothetical protein DPMN_014697 [Dreissena polymorpha]
MTQLYLPHFPVSSSVSVRRHLSKSLLLYDPVVPTLISRSVPVSLSGDILARAFLCMTQLYRPHFPISASVSVRRHLSKSLLMYDPVVPTSFPGQCQCPCQETS